MEVINRNRYSVNYELGEYVYKSGSRPLGLICLKKGKVKIVRKGINGSDQIIGLKKAIDIIGFRGLMGGNHYLSSAICLEDVTACIIKKNDFFKVIERNKNLAFKIMKSFANDLISSDGRLITLTQKRVRGRLAEALILINDIYGVDRETGYLNVILKRADLASLSNMTSSNAIRVLSSFKKENLVTTDHKRIKITNMNALKKISVFDK